MRGQTITNKISSKKGSSFGSLPPKGVTISDAQYNKMANLVYSLCGIHLGTGKKELLKARLVKRLRATGIGDVRAYMDFLQKDKEGSELISFLDCITTNKTDFFRESQHFEFLAQKILPNLKSLCGPKDSFRIWSAACSTGEEPYTLAIVLLQNQHIWSGRSASILASDISTKVLAHGKNGVYALERLTPIPKPILKTFFQKGVNRWEGHGRIRPQVRAMVDFQRINLMDQFNFDEQFHVIFCRNVMIYFDKKTRENLVQKFRECLVPGGYLFVGHSESLTGIEHKLKFVRPAVYRREV